MEYLNKLHREQHTMQLYTVCVLLSIAVINVYLIYILCMLHHDSYYFTSFNIVCQDDCVYEDPSKMKSSVYFNVRCILLGHPK